MTARPLRFHSPLVKLDVRISRIQLSDQGRFMLSPTGGWRLGRLSLRFGMQRCSLRLELVRSLLGFDEVGVRIALFEAYSMFIHIMACALPACRQAGLTPKRGLFPECSNGFVASTIPPGGSGRSDLSRVGLL